MLIKTAIIRKTDKGYVLFSRKKGKDGKRKQLGGPYSSRGQAEKREQQVEYFKHKDDDANDSMDAETHTLSKLSDLAKYLEEAGFIDKAKVLYDTMAAIDSSLEDLTSDYIPEEQSNVENQGYIGGDGTGGGYSMFNVPESARLAARLLQIASDLDEKGRFEEATELDNAVKEYTEEELEALENMPPEPELTDEELEEMAEYYNSDEALDGLDDLVRSNGRVGTGVTDNQNAGMFQGFSDAYFYSGYGNLESPYGDSTR